MPVISHMPGEQTKRFMRSAGDVFFNFRPVLRRCITRIGYEPTTYLLLWKPRLLLSDRLGGVGFGFDTLGYSGSSSVVVVVGSICAPRKTVRATRCF
jgi:hypothetical protein